MPAEMRLASRAYADRADNGEHTRVIDMAELDPAAARAQAEGLLESYEVINQIVSVNLDTTEPVV